MKIKVTTTVVLASEISDTPDSVVQPAIEIFKMMRKRTLSSIDRLDLCKEYAIRTGQNYLDIMRAVDRINKTKIESVDVETMVLEE